MSLCSSAACGTTRAIGAAQIAITPRLAFEPAPVASTGSQGYRALAAAIREVFPDAVVAPGLMVAATDSRHYRSVAGAAYRFLPLRLDPEGVSRIHGVNERIAIGSYAEMIAFYARLLMRANA